MNDEITHTCGLRIRERGDPKHQLKIRPDFYEAILFGGKNFELQKNDRDFKPGETVELQEWDDVTKQYTGRGMTITIGYLLKGSGRFGLADGYCIFGIENPVVYFKEGNKR